MIDKKIKYIIACITEFAKTKDLVLLLMERQKINLQEALITLYNSDLYSKLIDSDTELYLQSPLYIYEYLDEELKKGKLS